MLIDVDLLQAFNISCRSSKGDYSIRYFQNLFKYKTFKLIYHQH